MNKRLVCLLLSALMLVLCFTGCSKKTDSDAISDVNKEASKTTVTLSMYLMSEEEVSDEQAEMIEEAVNRITKSKFKAKIELRYFTEKEYVDALTAAFEETDDAREAKKAAEKALKEAIKRGEAVATEAESETAEETVINQHGIPELKYPSIEDYQVDIFYLGGYDMFTTFLQNEWLASLDEDMSTTAKLLKSYLSPAYLQYSEEISEGTYAVPVNMPIGEYTYMLLNKELLREYKYATESGNFYTKNDFVNLSSTAVQNFLKLVAQNDADEYIPLVSYTGEVDVSDIKYWSFDSRGALVNEFSVLGASYSPSFTYKGVNEFYSGATMIFDDQGFKNQVKVLATYRQNGYYKNNTGKTNADFAVGYIKGGAEIYAQYGEKYELIPVEMPKLTTDDIFDNMFAVGAHSSDISRSMEIITYMNTNVDFRNLLLYGIKDVNYELVPVTGENGEKFNVVTRLNEDYMMAPEKTGNTLIAYQLVEPNKDGKLILPTYDVREYYMVQNRDAVIDLAMGFAPIGGDDSVNLGAFQELRKTSKTLFDGLLAVLNDEENTVQKAEEFIASAAAQVSKNGNFQYLRGSYEFVEDYTPKEGVSAVSGEGSSFYGVYFAWLKANGIYQDQGA